MVLSLRHVLGKQLVNLVTSFVIQLSNLLILSNLFESFAGSSVDMESDLKATLPSRGRLWQVQVERDVQVGQLFIGMQVGIEAARSAYQEHSHPLYLLPFYLYC